MTPILYFFSDFEVPSDKELQECINLKKTNDSVIVLKWYHEGWYELWFTEESERWSVSDCRERMPKYYAV